MAMRPTRAPTRYPRLDPHGSSLASPRRVIDQFAAPALQLDHVEYESGCCLARHSESLAFLACTLQGMHWSSTNHGGFTCLPGTARFLPAGEPHENYFPVRSRCILVKLKPTILERALEYASLPDRPVQFGAPSGAQPSTLLSVEVHHPDDLSPLVVEELSLALLLAGSRESQRSTSPIPPWLRRVHEMLREESGRRFNLAELAGCAGRHPVQVCRQFHRRFCCTIGEYVRRLRVARAQSLLARPELSIVEIALICGFADQSQLTNTFRRLTGVTPGRYRQQFTDKAPLAL